MIDHANDLRRYARKLGHPSGDTPSVMAAAADHIDAQEAEIERLKADAAAYQLLRRGQHWSVIDGIGQTLRGEELDAAVAAVKGKT